MDWTAIIVALITSGSIAAVIKFGRIAWDARKNAGYQERVKEEQAEDSLATITQLEGEVEEVMDENQELGQRLASLEQLVLDQQETISRQALALSNCRHALEERP